MSFPVERNLQRLKDREISGKQYDAAVDCWFTADAKPYPVSANLKE